MPPAYRRILLKLSGEALMGEQQFGIDPDVATQIAKDIREIQQLGVQTGVWQHDRELGTYRRLRDHLGEDGIKGGD